MDLTLTGTLALARPPSPAPELPGSPAPVPSFRHVLERVGRELDQGERTLQQALGGGPRDAAAMIALQAGIYRYSEAVELTAKLVEHAAGGLKTTLQASA